TRAFLKIQDGCGYSCSFCTIPLARGESRSAPVNEVLEEARKALAGGFKELVLTGVNVGDYGTKTGGSLVAVLREMIKLDGLGRIRVSSIEPNLLSDDLLDFWLESTKVCNHFHIPLQSGSPSVLAGMRRRYRREWYADRLRRITGRAPLAGIGSDVIVGFPGETREHFEETYAWLVDQPVTYLHVFSYSRREDTVAADMGEQVSPEEKADRSERLRILSAKKRHAFHESLMGRTLSVLFESSDVYKTGLTENYAKVCVQSPSSLVNEIRSVRIDAASGDVCFGTVVENR
ncbi:MAG TPA: MiaB/RimO family radical SAM methylthiotransferase, partial [Bacteroidota bacterium]